MKTINKKIQAKLEILQKIEMAVNGLTAKEAKEKIENEFVNYFKQQNQ